ncbi:MAG: WecB/TagA/CpsF family glycosyltransferase [Clostridia bacterium]
MADKVDVLGVAFDNITRDEAVLRAYNAARGDGKARVVTPNSEIVYMARHDEELRRVLNNSDIVLPDGIGVVYAARILKTSLREKVAGIELGDGLCGMLAKTGEGIFLLGAKPGIADLAATALVEKHPGLFVAGVNDGYFGDDAKIIEKINNSGARVLFVCLGAPKQELWMAKNRDAINAPLMLGLGGSLDVYAGAAKRAPDIWIKLGLEWMYRLLKEPSRIGRMMALPKFLLAVLFSKKGGNKNA